MSKFAIIQNNIVINIIEWDGTTNWNSPKNCKVVEINSSVSVLIGSTYVDGVFSTPLIEAPKD